ncbi:hypothetical protein [Pisciglobus halotolerans]|uniref:Uncharacterized protein n=1 Tax=Pisciglobus halotolerans TaxID=745365 RepID=A0A1I3DTV4_9LACT|nr:hypothetical protein [Pisciglobus halotolerans]SFH90028.1 hypothetical protein SAMN04489868_1527 [Pisciglobus halotolerans]
MKTLTRILSKIVLTFIFWYVINRLFLFFFGTFIPGPEEMKGVIFLYALIFVVEVGLAYLCTSLVFRSDKTKRK